MKQPLSLFLSALLALTLAACAPQARPVPSETPIPSEIPAPTETPAPAETPEADWTEDQVLALFRDHAEPDWTVLHCVTTPDGAYDRVGVVLFTDGESDATQVAFLNAEGTFSRCGIYAPLAPEPLLIYEGVGTVSFRLLTETGELYSCRLSFSGSEDGMEIHFKAEDDLYNASHET